MGEIFTLIVTDIMIVKLYFEDQQVKTIQSQINYNTWIYILINICLPIIFAQYSTLHSLQFAQYIPTVINTLCFQYYFSFATSNYGRISDISSMDMKLQNKLYNLNCGISTEKILIIRN